MNKTLIGIIAGLMVATSVVYFVEASEELFEDQDMIKGPFFVIVATAYILIAIWTIIKVNSTHIIVALAGTIGLMILYTISVTEMAFVLGMEAGNVGHMGMVTKILQTGIIFGAIVALIQSKRVKQV